MNVLEPRWDFISSVEVYVEGYPKLEKGICLDEAIKMCELYPDLCYDVVYIISDGKYKNVDLKEAKRMLKLCLI